LESTTFRRYHGVIGELEHATFLSHGRTREVYCFPILLVFTLPHILSLFALVETICLKMWENLGEINVLACKMFTSGCRPWLKNVACLSSLLSSQKLHKN